MPQTIMIAASDPNISYLLQRYAEESGFEAVSVCQGRDVLSLAHSAHPSLIILDTELPGTTGLKVLRYLKDEAATRAIPVVIYSAIDEPSEGWGDDVAGYLPKSVMFDDFIAVLRNTGIYPS